MSRDEYMKQLENLLFDLPADEREEALRYYQDYFDDAGVSEESRIVEELGSPEKVAAFIKGNLYSKTTSEAGEYTERGYYNPYNDGTTNANAISKVGEEKEEDANYNNGTYNTTSTTNYQEEASKKDNTKTALIIALVVLTFPVWIGILGAAFGLTCGIFGALFGLTVGFGAAGIALLISSLLLIVLGIGQLFTFVPTGVVMIGSGFVLVALGLLFLFATIQIVSKLIPAAVRGITSLFNRVFHRDRRAMA